MNHTNRKSMSLVVAFAIVASLAAYAFAAGNTVTSSLAGDGTGEISGYTVSNIEYTSADDALTEVSFDLDENASTVRAAVGEASLVDCTGSDTAWSCPISGSIADADALRVLAHQ